MGSIRNGIFSKQNNNKIFSVKHLLIRGESANNAPVMTKFFSNRFKGLRNDFLEIGNMWLLSAITQYYNKENSTSLFVSYNMQSITG